MRFWRIALLLFICIGARAATINVAITNFNMTLATNDVIVTHITPPDFSGNYIKIGLPIRNHVTNGATSFNLLSGNYQLNIYGQTWNSNLLFAVPDSTNTYNLGTDNLWISGGNIFNYTPGVKSLNGQTGDNSIVAGNNITVTTSNGTNIIITAVGGGGNATNAIGSTNGFGYGVTTIQNISATNVDVGNLITTNQTSVGNISMLNTQMIFTNSVFGVGFTINNQNAPGNMLQIQEIGNPGFNMSFNGTTVTAPNFSGNLNASQLTSGTIPESRIGLNHTNWDFFSGNVLSEDTQNRLLTAGDGSTSVDWGNRVLIDSIGKVEGFWGQTGLGGNGVLLTNLNGSSISTAIPQSVLGNAVTNSTCIYLYANGTAWGSNGPLNTSGSLTAGFQEAINALPRVSNINSGYGGGHIIVAPGFYILQTNLAIPSDFPFVLDLEGTFLQTRVRLQGSTNKAQIYCTTNYTAAPLTNSLSIRVHGFQFESEAIYPTNFIMQIDGQNWAEIDHNVFISAYALTNGNGQLTKNFEANMPDQPCGLGGLNVNYFNTSAANATLSLHHNWFYGMAVAVADGAVVSRIENNYFSCIAVAQPNPNLSNPSAFATNLWRGNVSLGEGFFSGASAPLSAGAAIVLAAQGGKSCIVSFNEFFGCGAVAFVDPYFLLQDPIRFVYNRTSVCKYRVLSRDTGFEATSWIWDGTAPSSGDSNPGVPTDSIVTNNTVVMQANGNSTFTGISPIAVIYRGTVQGDSSITISGAPLTVSGQGVTASSFSGNGSAVTSLNASSLSSGTVPTARLGSGTANANTLLHGNSTWSAVAMADIASSGTIVTQNNSFSLRLSNNIAVDAAHALSLSNFTTGLGVFLNTDNTTTQWNAGTGLSWSGNTLNASGGAGLDTTAWHNTGDSFGAQKKIGTGDSQPLILAANGIEMARFTNSTGNPNAQIASADAIFNFAFGTAFRTVSIGSSAPVFTGSVGQGSIISCDTATNAAASEGVLIASKNGNQSGSYSIAAGRRVNNTANGVFMFTDSQDVATTNGISDRIFIRAQNGAVFNLNDSGMAVSNALGPSQGTAMLFGTGTNGLLYLGTNNPSLANGFIGSSNAVQVDVPGNLAAFMITSNGATLFQFRSLTKTANYTILASESGTHYNNLAAGGTVTNTLPSAVPGLQFHFLITTAQNMTVKASGTDTIRNAATLSAAGGVAFAATQGNSFNIYCDVSGKWFMEAVQGAWTVQ